MLQVRQPSDAHGYDAEAAQRFYTRLRERIARWLDEHTRVDPRVRDALLLLPDFAALLARLIADPRVDRGLKGQLILATLYVMSPLDLIPDFLMPLGLVDDTVAAALMLSRFARILAEPGEEVLREHWEGPGDVLAQIRHIAEAMDWLLNERIAAHLRRRLG
ncbi:MAG: YkvA family protein [Anaerolineae bacterium]